MSEEKTEAEYRESLLKHFLPPKGYDIDPAEWRRVLKHDAESFACDWLEWLARSQGGNVVASAVQDLAERQAQLVAVARAAKRINSCGLTRHVCNMDDTHCQIPLGVCQEIQDALSALAPDVLND